MKSSYMVMQDVNHQLFGDSVMEEISNDYEEITDTAIDNMIARFEPTIVAVLAVSVGLVLLSVMLPLAGVLSAI